ncbi:MAG: S8 family serine peptidase [Candidatus Competibacter sp.]
MKTFTIIGLIGALVISVVGVAEVQQPPSVQQNFQLGLGRIEKIDTSLWEKELSSSIQQSDQPPPQKSSIVESHYSANDFYYYQNRKIPLHRSLSEFVVKFKENSTKGAEIQLQALAAPAEVIKRAKQYQGHEFLISKLKDAKAETDIENAIAILRVRTDVEFAFPVLVDPKTNSKLFLTDEIVLKLKPDQTIEEVLKLKEASNLEVISQLPMTTDEYLLRVQDPKAMNPLEIANALFESKWVEWAEPNFVQDYKSFFTPNDPLFANQWHLWNTGQGGMPPGIDANAPAAWDYEQGSPNITIAVIDSGVEIGHEDLSANIFTNLGEIPGNGIDDDGNGYIDDIHGWDFVENDSNPSPATGPDNGHGTAAAGVAAAVGNNGKGVTGMCLHCKILPVRISNNGIFINQAMIANAIRYAASLADVLSNSWGGGLPSSVVQSAIQYATTAGRGGKGSVVLFATGNNATGFTPVPIYNIPAGIHRFIWDYGKDGSGNAGNDTAWLAWVLFPGAELVSFNTIPPGWTSSGNLPWSLSNDPTHADESLCSINSTKAGPIANNQISELSVVKAVPAGNLLFYAWVSSEANFDGLVFGIDYFNDGTLDLIGPLLSGVPPVVQEVAYPAAFPEAIAVGASSNLDCRSSYSEFGAELDFVAPSSGGSLNLRIATTDQTGAPGYGPGQYIDSGPTGFGGTSSATPLAAGLAGLILSRAPNMTQAEVRQLMQNTADKIGPEPYVNGRNNRYGYGRINAERALQGILPQQYTLTVSKAGTGSGTVTSNPAGINCGGDCSETYNAGIPVTLTATAAAGSTFIGWSGVCSGTSAACTVTMDAAKSATANFNAGSPASLLAGVTGSGLIYYTC